MAEALTKAHRDLLSLAALGELEVSFNHPDAIALGAMGFLRVDRHPLRRDSHILFGRSATITPAGRQALQEQG